MAKNYKPKTVNFYHLEAKNKEKESQLLEKIDTRLKETYSKLKNHKSNEIETRNETLKTTEGQGEVVDTQFLYDPHTHVCIFARTLGGLNKALLKTFLLRFCKIRGLEIAIIPDEIAIKELDKMKETSSLTYTIAKVNNLSKLANENRDELKDLEYASDLEANQMTMILKADSMNKKRVIDKAKMLFKNSEDLEIKKLELEGINDDGVFEPVDLSAA